MDQTVPPFRSLAVERTSQLSAEAHMRNLGPPGPLLQPPPELVASLPAHSLNAARERGGSLDTPRPVPLPQPAAQCGMIPGPGDLRPDFPAHRPPLMQVAQTAEQLESSCRHTPCVGPAGNGRVTNIGQPHAQLKCGRDLYKGCLLLNGSFPPGHPAS